MSQPPDTIQNGSRRSALRRSLVRPLALKLCVLACSLLQPFFGQAFAADSTDHPNIVFILADDLGYRELGCFGQQLIRTPHLDRLASQGMMLTQHYSGNAVCAPSRCVLRSGQPSVHHAVV